jgi:hypothetical protein
MEDRLSDGQFEKSLPFVTTENSALQGCQSATTFEAGDRTTVILTEAPRGWAWHDLGQAVARRRIGRRALWA